MRAWALAGEDHQPVPRGQGAGARGGGPATGLAEHRQRLNRTARDTCDSRVGGPRYASRHAIRCEAPDPRFAPTYWQGASHAIHAFFSCGPARLPEAGGTRCVCVCLPHEAMWSYAELHYIMDVAPRYMLPAQIERAHACGNAFLIAYQRLAEIALTQGRALYHLRPKLHEAAHMVLNIAATGYNPRYLACWADEDFIGRVCHLAKLTNSCRA